MGTIISAERFEKLTNSFSSLAPLIVVGDIGIDKYTFGEVKKISPEAPVPVLEVSKEWHTLGLAANISNNLKTLGMESTLCGVIGNDKNASVFENLLEDLELKTWGIVRTDDRPTIFKERVTTNVQQICRIDYESKDTIRDETREKLIERIDDFSIDHSAIILEDYAKGSLSKNILGYLISKFKEEGKIVAVDPGRTTPPLFYKGATLLKPNLIEANMMVKSFGYENEKLENIANILVDKLEIEQLVITLGSGGMALVDSKNNKGLKIIPTVANEVFDVSGAGDTAISLLTSSLLVGATLEEAAWISNCGAGVVVAKKGTATVSLLELKSFYKKLNKRFEK